MNLNVLTSDAMDCSVESAAWNDTPEMLAARLQSMSSRHPMKKGGGENVSLYDAICFDNLQSSLLEAQATGDLDAYDAERLRVTEHIVRHVNGALWFPDRGQDPADKRLPPAVANLGRDQIVDCYGFTMLASSCLELAGVEHWIGWAHGHSFLILPMGQGDTAGFHFVDPLSPRLSRNLNGMVPYADVRDINAQFVEHGRAVFRLRTDNFQDPEAFDILAKRHPWMKLNSRPNAHESLSREARTRLFVSIFLPRDGRAVLESHSRLIRASITGDTPTVTQAMLDLYGLHPDLDARNDGDYKRVYSHIQQLCVGGQFTTALRVVEAYFVSFGLTSDTRIALRQEKCLRLVADATRKAVGSVALTAGQERGSTELTTIANTALHGARQSLMEARQRYSKASQRLRPRHTEEVIAGRLASLEVV